MPGPRHCGEEAAEADGHLYPRLMIQGWAPVPSHPVRERDTSTEHQHLREIHWQKHHVVQALAVSDPTGEFVGAPQAREVVPAPQHGELVRVVQETRKGKNASPLQVVVLLVDAELVHEDHARRKAGVLPETLPTQQHKEEGDHSHLTPTVEPFNTDDFSMRAEQLRVGREMLPPHLRQTRQKCHDGRNQHGSGPIVQEAQRRELSPPARLPVMRDEIVDDVHLLREFSKRSWTSGNGPVPVSPQARHDRIEGGTPQEMGGDGDAHSPLLGALSTPHHRRPRPGFLPPLPEDKRSTKRFDGHVFRG
mmetsp:Transcript_57653/g.153596  ORF Transcript_57653/g.153596 Transcript_57653/m.153596 type:complete len:306 (-) Transcript_57653:116-1033(-)